MSRRGLWWQHSLRPIGGRGGVNGGGAWRGDGDGGKAVAGGEGEGQGGVETGGGRGSRQLGLSLRPKCRKPSTIASNCSFGMAASWTLFIQHALFSPDLLCLPHSTYFAFFPRDRSG